jgi:hypothetical protein
MKRLPTFPCRFSECEHAPFKRTQYRGSHEKFVHGAILNGFPEPAPLLQLRTPPPAIDPAATPLPDQPVTKRSELEIAISKLKEDLGVLTQALEILKNLDQE